MRGFPPPDPAGAAPQADGSVTHLLLAAERGERPVRDELFSRDAWLTCQIGVAASQ